MTNHKVVEYYQNYIPNPNYNSITVLHKGDAYGETLGWVVHIL